MNKDNFFKSMMLLQEYYNTKKSEMLMAMYYQKLQHISDTDFEAVCSAIVDTFQPYAKTPFPLIKDFVDRIPKKNVIPAAYRLYAPEQVEDRELMDPEEVQKFIADVVKRLGKGDV